MLETPFETSPDRLQLSAGGQRQLPRLEAPGRNGRVTEGHQRWKNAGGELLIVMAILWRVHWILHGINTLMEYMYIYNMIYLYIYIIWYNIYILSIYIYILYFMYTNRLAFGCISSKSPRCREVNTSKLGQIVRGTVIFVNLSWLVVICSDLRSGSFFLNMMDAHSIHAFSGLLASVHHPDGLHSTSPIFYWYVESHFKPLPSGNLT
jgi:hypothetical protein